MGHESRGSAVVMSHRAMGRRYGQQSHGAEWTKDGSVICNRWLQRDATWNDDDRLETFAMDGRPYCRRQVDKDDRLLCAAVKDCAPSVAVGRVHMKLTKGSMSEGEQCGRSWQPQHHKCVIAFRFFGGDVAVGSRGSHACRPCISEFPREWRCASFVYMHGIVSSSSPACVGRCLPYTVLKNVCRGSSANEATRQLLPHLQLSRAWVYGLWPMANGLWRVALSQRSVAHGL